MQTSKSIDLVEVRERILHAAMGLFHRFGIRSVKMDDVARAVSMSKKTLYQYFDDKDELVTETTKEHIQLEQQEFDAIWDRSSNAIEELFMVSRCLRKNLSDLSPNLLIDLKSLYPASWGLWQEFKDGYIYKRIANNLELGKAAGHYRKNMDPEIIARLRIAEVQMLFDFETYPSNKFDFRQVQMQLFDHFIFGICTEEGRQLFQQYLESEKHETIA